MLKISQFTPIADLICFREFFSRFAEFSEFLFTNLNFPRCSCFVYLHSEKKLVEMHEHVVNNEKLRRQWFHHFKRDLSFNSSNVSVIIEDTGASLGLQQEKEFWNSKGGRESV